MTGPIEAVLADAPPTGPIRIASVTIVDGRPLVRVDVAADRTAAAAAVARARARAGVAAVSVDHPVHITGSAAPAPASASSTAAAAQSGDAFRTQQWALDSLRAEATWGLHTAAGQTVAVIDTGVDATHPDLAGVVLPGQDYVTAGGDGRVDPHGHGTHVAGIIAAVANNGIGVAGLAQGARILPLRVLDATGNGYSSAVATALQYAADAGVGQVNLSLAGTNNDAVLAAAVSYAQSKNVLVVAAAGNDRQACTPVRTTDCGNPVMFPAALPGVLAVAATTSIGDTANFSETGSYVGIAAPGAAIISTWPGAEYASMSGTSMATPYAAAAAALLRAERPDMSATAVLNRLVATADDLAPAGRDDTSGAGLVDPYRALSLAAPVSAASQAAIAAKATGLGLTITSYATVPGGSVGYASGYEIYYATPSTATYAVHGAILTQYGALGGASGFLGLPTSDESGPSWRVSQFAGGSIYWSVTGGAHEVYGGVRGAYLAVGGITGPLGPPTSGEYAVPNGRATDFTGGEIIWSPAYGPHAVYGAIAARYRSLGGPSGFLGLPSGEEGPAGPGRVSTFVGGDVYWGPTTGSFEVHGEILGRYRALGGPAGTLGLPTSDEFGPSWRQTNFAGGAIGWLAGTGAHAVYGAIAAHYRDVGGAGGIMGVPVSEEGPAGAGRVSHFATGDIYWGPATGTHEVHGAILAYYAATGAADGGFGLPVGDETDAPGGRSSAFVGGIIYWSPATGAYRQ